MTEQKRGRGRPKKVDVEQKNPDCEPATKGFVKCVARGVVRETEISGAFLTMGCIWGAVAIFAFVVAKAFADEYSGAVLIIGALGMIYHLIISFLVFRTPSMVSGIEKYTPPEPACEKKKECE